ncbi:c-type cytochrome [Geobacter hydrogenophilus]|uniref:Cytochrome c domain-containing protein n=1 Tax=Geobacter hydrogenophilus TaxID=40983 RepID=A0A9W6LBZ5_9BACT|nr:c-type cytochrome [Geobacter hydrogenophilus]MBT0894345.1 c-type cytochrome [Geobacter hydrogenophilus]GLI38368.1 hypothetical protein GHYDROH2_18690 [Geobacter hydrogenophilus]
MARGILRTAVSRACLVLVLSIAAHAYGDPGKDLFDKQCSGCHTVGGGDSGGPDLKGVTDRRSEEWLESIIIHPDTMAATDPARKELIKKYGYEMPTLGISHDDAIKIITWLKGGGGGAAQAGAPPADEHPEVVVTPALVAKGKALFTGQKPLANGGAPCIACHRISTPGITGGNLAVSNLSASYQKMGEKGMRGALKALKFPTMKKIYENRPLTDDEVTSLIALYKDAALTKSTPSASFFPAYGAGTFVVFLVGLTLYKRRTR